MTIDPVQLIGRTIREVDCQHGYFTMHGPQHTGITRIVLDDGTAYRFKVVGDKGADPDLEMWPVIEKEQMRVGPDFGRKI